MKFIRVFLFALLFAPVASFAATNEFTAAAQLLAAAKNADIQQVQALINDGANVNYTDSTGLSIVCTALMNNDVRAAQILQMYGADASKCDRQIKQYNSRNKPKGSGGLFGGLSSAQSITLAAAGAAVIVGGLFFLTDWLNPGNDNDNVSSSSGGRGEGSQSGGSSSATGEVAFTIPNGPAMLANNYDYDDSLDKYSTENTDYPIYYDNYNLMTNGYKQNYLLMMHGYSPFARGYFGMQTLRSSNNAPLNIDGNNFGSLYHVMGGIPVNVALVTANGVDVTANSGDSSLKNKFMLWSTLNNDGTGTNGASNDMLSSKYYNNEITRGSDNSSLSDDSVAEDSVLITTFDLSGHGTAIANIGATADDNLIAKVVGGADTGFTNADYVGFMPNGQMTVFRTGGGTGMVTPTDSFVGSFTLYDSGDLAGELQDLNIDGLALTVNAVNDNTTIGGVKSFVATDSADNEYSGYIGVDGYLYIDTVPDDGVVAFNQAYELDTNASTLTLVKEQGGVDYSNYKALYLAANLSGNMLNVNPKSDLNGRSKVTVLANASVVPALHDTNVQTIDYVRGFVGTTSSATATLRQTVFASLVNQYYDVNTTDGTSGTDALPGTDAINFLSRLGSSYSPITIFATGSTQINELESSTRGGKTYEATFENVVPLIYSNTEHLFMSVVGVVLDGDGTKGQESVSGYTPGEVYQVAQWTNTNGTPDDTSDDTYYRARVCGVAGTGTSDVDPWCFASAGVTDELAVASAAGAVGVLQSAFSYMDTKQIFTLLALTADGPFLATDADGKPYTTTKLASDLQTMYSLPADYQVRVTENGEDYLSVFKEVFGYGLINLERATTPGKNVKYFAGDADNPDIVSASGNAYWRAATNSAVRASSALPMRGATITTSAYDVLTSVDGSMSLPRIWKNSFAIGNSGRHALYMGDTLGELKTRRDDSANTKIGNLSFQMARSGRAYNDNMNGLDQLRLSYDNNVWHLGADYQHYLTDGASRFSGLSNPILALASNAITTNIGYDFGNWTFGARAFSGSITNDGLLENDPTLSAQFTPATLGWINGAQSNVGWGNEKIVANASFGFVHETDTLLGAQTAGLFGLGAGDTQYVDAELRYSPFENVTLKMRGTYARTNTVANGLFVADVSTIESNAFAFGADIGSFSFAIARPLAAYNGAMKYSYADYAIVENDDGTYGIDVVDAGVRNLKFGSNTRELRLSGEYRHSFGEFTDGALGFIYRVNPNNTNEFGNESIFMLKMTHRVGI